MPKEIRAWLLRDDLYSLFCLLLVVKNNTINTNNLIIRTIYSYITRTKSVRTNRDGHHGVRKQIATEKLRINSSVFHSREE